MLNISRANVNKGVSYHVMTIIKGLSLYFISIFLRFQVTLSSAVDVVLMR